MIPVGTELSRTDDEVDASCGVPSPGAKRSLDSTFLATEVVGSRSLAGFGIVAGSAFDNIVRAGGRTPESRTTFGTVIVSADESAPIFADGALIAADAGGALSRDSSRRDVASWRGGGGADSLFAAIIMTPVATTAAATDAESQGRRLSVAAAVVKPEEALSAGVGLAGTAIEVREYGTGLTG